MPTIDIDRDAAHEAAQHELGKPIYPKASLTERLVAWLDELMYRMTDGFLDARRLAHHQRPADRARDRDSGGGTHRPTHHADQPRRQARPLRLARTERRRAPCNIAEQYASEGNWTVAIRHRLRAVARQLEEDGVLNPVPGRTATELAKAAGEAVPDLSGELLQAANAFNDVTYGERPGTGPAYRMIADLDDHLRSRGAATAFTPSAPATDTWTVVR